MERAEREQLQRQMVRLAGGDRSAFHPVFDLTWPLLRGFARRLLKADADAEDAAQQALMKVLSRAASFDPRRDALSWILAIGANECRTLRRRARVREEVDRVPPSRPGGAGADERLIEQEMIDAAREVVARLTPTDAEAVLAAIGADGARRPDISGPAFRKRVERALVRLREAWRNTHGTS
jgi:RNA polymerase sigma-70 factor, ECF subfamily